MKRLFVVPFLLFAIAQSTLAADWPQFRHDAARSGYTPDPLPAKLKLRWTYRPAHPPQPAWVGADTRMSFDHAAHTVLVDGLVIFGDSVDGKVYALDAKTGEERWTFYTDAPIRFAPAAWKDRIFVAGDDGYLYCLKTKTGALVWKKRGGPMDDMLLGNGRMISRWPSRGAPTVLDDVVYYSAGIWPSEGVYIYALDPETGEALWLNDTAGYMAMDQPHPTAFAKSGVSSQGYLTATDDVLLVPTGRSVPAAFDPADGSFRYFHLQEQRAGSSGPFVGVVDGRTFAAHDIYDASDGKALTRGIPCATMAAFPDHLVYARDEKLRVLDRPGILVEKQGADRKGNVTTRISLASPAWSMPLEGSEAVSLIGAGRIAVLGTTANTVLTIDTATRKIVATRETDGLPLGLAAADGQLVVSTDQGTVYCFDAKGARRPAVIERTRHSFPAESEAFAAAAEEIVARTGITKGYCLDIECGDGRLAYELAQRTDLYVCAVDSDPDNVRKARANFDAAGLYGNRVVVLQRDPADTRLPNRFANLVVSGRSVTESAVLVESELTRIQRPYGGVICTGKPGELHTKVSGPLEGAGEWTHLYSDPANTNCSDDALVKGPLGMLWFVDNDLFMPSRHGRGPSPLFWNGLLFVEGLSGLRCLDAYNGHVVWEYPIENVLLPYDQEHLNGAAITGNNLCIADGSLFVRVENRCLRLDALTGKKTAEFKAPTAPDGTVKPWGYLAVENGNLYGSVFNNEHTVHYAYGRSDMSQLFSESMLFFVLDPDSGDVKWTYTPTHSIRNNSIAIGAGRVYFIDRPIAVRDRRKADATEHPFGELVTLHAATGEEAWRVDDVYGTLLALSTKHDVLLMMYQNTRFKLASELGGRMSAFRATTGEPLWDIKARYDSRPILNDTTIYAQPGAWDLLTGERKDFAFSRSYGCGTIAGSRHLLTFRSATLGYLDLTADRGVENYGGIRPGCWINTLPVGGMILMPDATDRCSCSYLIKATIALEPRGLRPPVITPKGGASPEPIVVALETDVPDATVRYTLDGTSPRANATRYADPFRITESATLTARAFRDGMPPSQTVEAAFDVDPAIIRLDDAAWTPYDSPGATPSESDWQLDGGVLTERSNLHRGGATDPDPAMERAGSFRIYAAESPMKDGVLTLELASSDDDTLGVAFRFGGPDQHYVWSMDRQRAFHALACKDGDSYQLLAANAGAYDRNKWYSLRVELDGSRIAIFLDDEQEFELEDATHSSGAFALYAWGCAGAKFRNVRWEER
ncbi:MAG: PQQ-binding-like beta-propeller repeat protein [bacterium]|nr:PQQ-binding-like beta-propeller repeat protein [bacterium]